VCGFLINKLKKKFNCDDWIKNLTTKNLDQRHIFRLYKEFDKKLGLNYATKIYAFVWLQFLMQFNVILIIPGHLINLRKN
jgi:hypothetical protein